MTTDPRMTAILEDLAAGRMDAAEAARRIDALKAEQHHHEPATPDAPPEPSNEDLAAQAGRLLTDLRVSRVAPEDLGEFAEGEARSVILDRLAVAKREKK